MNEPIIRLIEAKDNATVKSLVQTTLAEFGLFGEGYAGVDPELNDMYAAYSDELSAYYVVEVSGEICGVAGYAPLAGCVRGTIAELRKMYLLPKLRGQGVGQQLIELCLSEATDCAYSAMYLETVTEMQAAQKLYVKNGFKYLEDRIGDTGHNQCGVCMMRPLHD